MARDRFAYVRGGRQVSPTMRAHALTLMVLAALATGCARHDRPAPDAADAGSYAPSPCRTSDLAFREGGGDAGMGHRNTIIVATNRTAGACTLRGFPALTLLGLDGVPLQVPQVRPVDATYFAAHDSIRTIVLAPGESASLQLHYLAATGGLPCQDVATLQFTAPGDTNRAALALPFEACGPTLDLMPFVAGLSPG